MGSLVSRHNTARSYPRVSASTLTWLPMLRTTHDADGFAAQFVAAGGFFHPGTLVSGRILIRNAADQHDRQADHQLRHRTGVGIRGVEYRLLHAQWRFSGPPGWCRYRSSQFPELVGRGQYGRGYLGFRMDTQ